MKRKILTILLSIAVAVTIAPSAAFAAELEAPAAPETVDAPASFAAEIAAPVIGEFTEGTDVIYESPCSPYYGNIFFTGKDCTSNKVAQAAIDYQLRYYKDNAKFKGKGQCWGYAEYIRQFMGGGGKPKYYKKKNSHKLLVKVLKGCKPGTHVRFTSTKKGGGRSHSVVIFKFTSKEVIWADNNWGWDNRIHYYRGTPEDFNYGYKYLYFVHQPKKFKKRSKIVAAVTFDSAAGANSVAWPLVKGAKKYEVYRSYKKSGGYSRIATVSGNKYEDKDSVQGKTAYYKVKTKGKNCSAGSAKRKLASPKVRFQILSSGRVKLTWDPVEGATKYMIYWDDWDDSPEKLATVSNTSWMAVDTEGDKWLYNGFFSVVAASGASGGNSDKTWIQAFGGPKQVQLGAEDVFDDYWQLSWEEYWPTDSYEIYRAEAGGKFQKVATVEYYYNYYHDTSREEGKTYRYKIRAVLKADDIAYPKVITLRSAFSNEVTF